MRGRWARVTALRALHWVHVFLTLASRPTAPACALPVPRVPSCPGSRCRAAIIEQPPGHEEQSPGARRHASSQYRWATHAEPVTGRSRCTHPQRPCRRLQRRAPGRSGWAGLARVVGACASLVAHDGDGSLGQGLENRGGQRCAREILRRGCERALPAGRGSGESRVTGRPRHAGAGADAAVPQHQPWW